MRIRSTLKVAAVMLAALNSLTSCNSNLRDQALDAFRAGDLVKVKALLKDNPKVVSSSSDSNGWTPLHTTAKYGHKDVAELLLVNKAEVNVTDNDGYTPLELAEAYQKNLPYEFDAWMQAEEMLRLLRQHGGARFAGMAKLEFDVRLLHDITKVTECPHTGVLDISYCVPAGNTRVGLQYSESALAYTEEVS
jgi:hypothetical protein